MVTDFTGHWSPLGHRHHHSGGKRAFDLSPGGNTWGDMSEAKQNLAEETGVETAAHSSCSWPISVFTELTVTAAGHIQDDVGSTF